MSLVAIGLNHKSVPLDLLERMTLGESDLPKALHALIARPHLSEAVVLSTCNRTEVYAFAERFHGAYQDVRDSLAELCHLLPEEFSEHLYAHYDADAAQHLFTVASGLDSAVIGESEVLGQVRRAWEVAQAEDTAGASINRLFRHAIEVGKRARTETTISHHITSVSQAAVAMAAQHLGTLDGRNVLVLGAGEMGEGMAVSLAAAGVREIVVVNRTFENGVELANRVQGRAARLADLPSELAAADVLLTSTGASSMIVETADVAAVMAARGSRPLLIVDSNIAEYVAVPRDVDPAAAALDGVTLLDMNDLTEFAEAGMLERRREVAAVVQIVDAEVARYVSQSSAREVAPLIGALHDRGEAVRLSELERQRARLADLTASERAAVEAVTRGIVAKLLHAPTVRLKDASGNARGERLADALRDLFDL